MPSGGLSARLGRATLPETRREALNMLRYLILPLLLGACAATPAPELAPASAPPMPAATPCPPAAELAQRGDERARGEAILDMAQSERETLAIALLPCLGDPDPALRDGVTYTALSQMMRSQLIGSETLAAMKAELLGMLAAEDDPAGFARPFAALVLAEVARTDRVAPWMTPQERAGLIAAADAYLASLTDYRGFDEAEGWRHGVAHAADFLMQLSLNPEITRPQAEAILATVARKVGTPEHAYVFGESERLAAPVMYLARREIFSEADWEAWFSGLWPADDPLRENAYTSEAALTKLHNLRAFSQAIYVSAKASNEATYEPVARGAFALLNSLP
ncbi:hypothetical protein HHI_11749 [Hyphomonas hirschiana VP5]|nr:hypothetical protein HHI_11749 [Hyphomonas hirschiana VP5]